VGATCSYDTALLAEVELRFREDLWRAAPKDAVEEAEVRHRRFGPILATVFGDLPESSLLNLVQGTAESGAVEDGHLAAAIEWVRQREVDYLVSANLDRPGNARAEIWLTERGYERGATVRRFLHPGTEAVRVNSEPLEIHELTSLETESVDDKHLGPIALGDFVDQRMGAALDQVGIGLASDPLQTFEEVTDELDLEIFDPLECHVLDRGPLVASPCRSEGHQRDLLPILSRWLRLVVHSLPASTKISNWLGFGSLGRPLPW
jgi:hypothetical protein